MKHVFTFLALSIIYFSNFSQIVNIEKERHITDTIGWSGDVNAGGAYIDQDVEIFSIDAGSHVQYKTVKDLFLLLSQFNLIKAGDTNFDQAAYLHFRYNYKASERLRLEAFTQIQYNDIDNIDIRWLTGFGPRWKLMESKSFKLYIASLPMLERERLSTGIDPTSNTTRLSSYVSFTLKPNEHVTLYSTTYYQPRIVQWEDGRWLNEESFSFAISKRLGMSSSFIFAHDPFPAPGAPTNKTRFKLGLSYDF